MTTGFDEAIWNRACSGKVSGEYQGDLMLSNLLRFHNLAMNGGIFHAVECLSSEELDKSLLGYQFYGLEEVATVFGRAKEVLEKGYDPEEHEESLDQEYSDLIADDEFLFSRLKSHHHNNPSAYAPV